MAELHETMYGKKLLECDIPRIAKALERIATALEKRELSEEMKQMEASIDPEWDNDIRRGR